MIDLKNKLECLFDTYFFDTDKCNPNLVIHKPIPREIVMVNDEAWEGNGCIYYNFFFDKSYKGFDGNHENGMYRMYYLGIAMENKSPDCPKTHKINVCYAESDDGLSWIKPKLGISEFDNSKENNIILGIEEDCSFDNYYVFYDDNPNCSPSERYKGVAYYRKANNVGSPVLACWTSSDGIHFGNRRVICEKGVFDSLNVAFYDKTIHKYRCYTRGYHNEKGEDYKWFGTRDIRYIESEDFVNWSDPVKITFDDGIDQHMYTNVISPYYRSEGIYIGFPTRYIERKEWTKNYDDLCGKELRKLRMELHPRYGLAVTDSVFICSRDGINFTRYDEGFFEPGIEKETNWVYGDGYPARGFIETVSDFSGQKEISMFLKENHWTNLPAALRRYTLRIDGFVSLHAGRKEETAYSKEFTYDGDNLYINFSTSAKGYIKFTLCHGKERYESVETFGNSLERIVRFDDDIVSKLKGKKVTMEIRIMDADLYSLKFN